MRLLDHIRSQDPSFTVSSTDEDMIAEGFRRDPFAMTTVTSWEVTKNNIRYHFQNVVYDPVCSVFKVEDGKDLLILAELLSYVCPERLRVITDLPFNQVRDAIWYTGTGTGKQMIHEIRGEEICLAPGTSYIQFDLSYFENPIEHRGARVLISEEMSGMSRIPPVDRAVYIANRITSTYEYKNYGDEGHSISSLLRTGKGVCQAIASLFNESLICSGIPSRVVSGTLRDEKGKDTPHAWNMCRIGDDGWIHIDLTAILGRKLSDQNDLYIKQPLLYRYNAEMYSDECSDMMWRIHEAVKNARITEDDDGCIRFGPLKLQLEGHFPLMMRGNVNITDAVVLLGGSYIKTDEGVMLSIGGSSAVISDELLYKAGQHMYVRPENIPSNLGLDIVSQGGSYSISLRANNPVSISDSPLLPSIISD